MNRIVARAVPRHARNGFAVQEEDAVTISIEEPVTLTFALRYAHTRCRAAAMARLVRAGKRLSQLLELLHQGDTALADSHPATVAERAAGYHVRSLQRARCHAFCWFSCWSRRYAPGCRYELPEDHGHVRFYLAPKIDDEA